MDEKEYIGDRIDAALLILLFKEKEPNFKDFTFNRVYSSGHGGIISLEYFIKNKFYLCPVFIIQYKPNESNLLDEVRKRALNYDTDRLIKGMFVHIDKLNTKNMELREQVYQYWIVQIMLTLFIFTYITLFHP